MSENAEPSDSAMIARIIKKMSDETDAAALSREEQIRWAWNNLDVEARAYAFVNGAVQAHLPIPSPIWVTDHETETSIEVVTFKVETFRDLANGFGSVSIVTCEGVEVERIENRNPWIGARR